METQNRASVHILCLYAEEDRVLAEGLKTHLALLKRQKLIVYWDPYQVTSEVKLRLEATDIVILLISADFIASDSCYKIWMQEALQKHGAGEVCIIPILVRPADVTDAPFASLQVVPKNDRAVTTWENRDEAWVEVEKGIRDVVIEWQKNGDKRQNSEQKSWAKATVTAIERETEKTPSLPARFKPNESDPHQKPENVPVGDNNHAQQQSHGKGNWKIFSLKRVTLTFLAVIVICLGGFWMSTTVGNVKNASSGFIPGSPRATAPSTFSPIKTHESTPTSILPPQETGSTPTSQPTSISSLRVSAPETLEEYCQSLLDGYWQNGSWISNAHQFIASSQLPHIGDSTTKPEPPAEIYHSCQIQKDEKDTLPPCSSSREIHVVAIIYFAPSGNIGPYYREFFVQKVNIGWVITGEGDLGSNLINKDGTSDRKYPVQSDCNDNNIVPQDSSVG